MFLVVVDAYSKCLEIAPRTHATSTNTITALRHIFSSFGLPEHLVTDAHSQFSQASTTRNTTLDKRFPSLNYRHPLESKGFLKFRLKIFLDSFSTFSVVTR